MMNMHEYIDMQTVFIRSMERCNNISTNNQVDNHQKRRLITPEPDRVSDRDKGAPVMSISTVSEA